MSNRVGRSLRVEGYGRKRSGMLDVSRKELKYKVDPYEISRLKQRLALLMKSDPHNGKNGYRVRSLYFDTPFDTDYEDKAGGYNERQKIRLRIYDAEQESAKLELKQKKGAAQRKRSLLLSREEAQQMICGRYEILRNRQEELALWLYMFMTRKCYRPKCVVEYDRLAYYLEHNDTRVTFDMRLRSGEGNYDIFDNHLMLYPVSGAMENTMEVKFSGFLLTHIKNELNCSERMSVSSSKYCRSRLITKS